jgi:F-type H+-transporting ATPase subunit b
MPQLDISTFSPQIIWLIITFLILYVLMAKVALPRIGNILEQRQNRIDDNLDMAQHLRNESNIDAESYDKAITEAREQARKAIQETTEEMSIETARRQGELGARLSGELRSAEDQISAAKTASLKNIHESAASVTSEAMKALIGEKPTDNAIKQAISSALKVSNKEINK